MNTHSEGKTPVIANSLFAVIFGRGRTRIQVRLKVNRIKVEAVRAVVKVSARVNSRKHNCFTSTNLVVTNKLVTQLADLSRQHLFRQQIGSRYSKGRRTSFAQGVDMKPIQIVFRPNQYA